MNILKKILLILLSASISGCSSYFELCPFGTQEASGPIWSRPILITESGLKLNTVDSKKKLSEIKKDKINPEIERAYSIVESICKNETNNNTYIDELISFNRNYINILSTLNLHNQGYSYYTKSIDSLNNAISNKNYTKLEENILTVLGLYSYSGHGINNTDNNYCKTKTINIKEGPLGRGVRYRETLGDFFLIKEGYKPLTYEYETKNVCAGKPDAFRHGDATWWYE